MIAQISIFPIGTKSDSLSRYVAEAVQIVDKSGLAYRVTSMGTIIEGEWDAVMKTVKALRDRMLKKADRVYLTISIDDRKGGQKRIEAKVASVENRLNKKLKK